MHWRVLAQVVKRSPSCLWRVGRDAREGGARGGGVREGGVRGLDKAGQQHRVSSNEANRFSAGGRPTPAVVSRLNWLFTHHLDPFAFCIGCAHITEAAWTFLLNKRRSQPIRYIP